MEDKVLLTIFTDPMMGLSYESEPIMERLARNYAGQIEFHYVMSLLVRDVADFMTPAERALPPEEGIRRYCARLAKIYKSEESIGGLPIHMEVFRLFDAEHRSSRPLCLAYKAAQLAAPEKADAFLTALRHATVLDGRPTTHDEEILRVVRHAGIDEALFEKHFRDGSAGAALERDLALTRSLGIRSLPTCLIRYKDKAVLLQSFEYPVFANAVDAVIQAAGSVDR